MASILPPISKFFNPFFNPLATVPSAPITIGISVIRMFHSISSSLARSNNFLSFYFLLFSLYCQPNGKIYLNTHGFFFIPDNCMLLILQDRFWVVHIPFLCRVKFKLVALFLVFTFLTQSSYVFLLKFTACDTMGGTCFYERGCGCQSEDPFVCFDAKPTQRAYARDFQRGRKRTREGRSQRRQNRSRQNRAIGAPWGFVGISLEYTLVIVHWSAEF